MSLMQSGSSSSIQLELVATIAVARSRGILGLYNGCMLLIRGWLNDAFCGRIEFQETFEVIMSKSSASVEKKLAIFPHHILSEAQIK